jgi:transposase, IS5 family
MKTKKSRSLFDEEFRLKKISTKQDPLEKLNKNINWDLFRPTLNQTFEKESKGKGGRPPYDYVMILTQLAPYRSQIPV